MAGVSMEGAIASAAQLMDGSVAPGLVLKMAKLDLALKSHKIAQALSSSKVVVEGAESYRRPHEQLSRDADEDNFQTAQLLANANKDFYTTLQQADTTGP